MIASLFRLALPLVLSMGAVSLQQFSNRAILGAYSELALAAATPASGVVQASLCLFQGTAFYATTLVARALGARQPQQVGQLVRAGLLLGLLGQLALLILLWPIARGLEHSAQDAEVVRLELEYIQLSAFSGFPNIASGVLSGFFSARGKTRVLLGIGVVLSCLHVALDYALVFGRLGLPELGMRGAAIATVVLAWIGFLVLLLLSRGDPEAAPFELFRTARVSLADLKRLLGPGIYNGLHFLIDAAAWALFAIAVGQLGRSTQALSNLLFQLHSLSLLPILGLGQAYNILLGRELGRRRQEDVTPLFRAAFTLGLIWVFIWSLFLGLFGDRVLRALGAQVMALDTGSAWMFACLAALALGHMVVMLSASALKAALSVSYVVKVLALAQGFLFLGPLFLGLHFHRVRPSEGLVLAWLWFALSTLGMGLVLVRRASKIEPDP